MTIYAASSGLQTGLHTAVTWNGLGEKGSNIPASGPNGSAYAYPSLDLPADNNLEIRGLIKTGPVISSGSGSIDSFTAYDDTSFQLAVTGNVIVSWTWDLVVDNVVVGSDLLATVDFTGSVEDTIAPVISLFGASVIELNVGDTYTELGATWTDNIDGSGSVSDITGTVNTNSAGSYTVFL